MAYQIHYFIEFKNLNDDDVGVAILEKDYGGAAVEIKASGPSPVIIDYKSGDFYSNDPIRASTATIKYYNEGSLPITTFSSDDDTKYFAIINFNKSGGLAAEIWRGFLSQDDCIEDLSPTPNEVSLTFMDGLGQLRQQYFTDLSGDVITGQLSLKSALYYILFGKTGLNLPVKVFLNTFENAMSDRSDDPAFEPFAQTVVDSDTFLLTRQTVRDNASGPNSQVVQLKDKVQDCYTVLQNILDAWGCTIIQAGGYWNIVRWFELKQFDNAIPGTRYDADFTNTSAITFDNIKIIENPSATAYFQTINVNQSRQLFRGNEFTRLTFNYVQPFDLLQNQDLSQLGALIRTFTTGSGTSLVTTNDYVFTDWIVSPDNSVVPYPLETYIRVNLNYLGIEIDRFAVVAKGVIGQSIWATAFKVNVNDQATLSFRVSTNNNTSSGTSVYNIKIFPPGTTNFRVSGGVPFYGLKITTDGTPYWDYNSSGWAFNHDDLISPVSVDIDMPAFPIDGVMLISLPTDTTDGSGTSATYYKDINFTLSWFIAGNTQITGQYNESRQVQPIKKNIDKLIYFDDSPKDDIQGVMFLTDGATKTSSWHRWPLVEEERFGWIQTVDWEYLTNVVRSKISGSYSGLTDSTNIFLSALSVIQFEGIPDGNYIFGPVSFDLKNAEFSGTVQEVYNTGEYTPGYDFPGTEFTNLFQYIYANLQR